MKTTFDAWRPLAALLAVSVTAGCAVTSGLDDREGSGSRTVTASGASPAGERVIAGNAEMVLTTRAWPTFEEARADPITTLEDGSPLYAYIRASRSLGELAHPSNPSGSYAFSEYPHLFLQVGETDSLRILGTCYITLTSEEAGMRELVVPLAPLTFRPGQIPADCWLSTVVAGRSGNRSYEVRLAGFAGKFESWLPVPDLLAVTPVPTDFSNGASQYATMLRATPLRSATLVASTATVGSPAVSSTTSNPATLSSPAPNLATPAPATQGRSRFSYSAPEPPPPRPAVQPFWLTGRSGTASPAADPVAASPAPSLAAAGPAPAPMPASPALEPAVAGPAPVPAAAGPAAEPVAVSSPVPSPGSLSWPVPTVPAPMAAAPSYPTPAPAAPSPTPGPATSYQTTPSPAVPSPAASAPAVPWVPNLATMSPTAYAAPMARSAPSLVATNSPPLPGARQDIGNSRMELQLQSLSAALLGRRPSEAYFVDGQWTSTADPRGRVWQQHAHAAAIFKGASCSWQRLKAYRRPGAAGLLDVEPAGEPIDINCSDLK